MSEAEHEKLESLRKEIQKGLDDLEAGRYEDGPKAMAEIRERLLRMKAERSTERTAAPTDKS
jgi:hypothetical protein